MTPRTHPAIDAPAAQPPALEPQAPESDDAMVELEGELVRWGDLPGADRHAYLAGGYPF